MCANLRLRFRSSSEISAGKLRSLSSPKNGDCRLSAAADATAAARHPSVLELAAARSMRECLGEIGSAAIAMPICVNSPGSFSSPKDPPCPCVRFRPFARVALNAPKIANVLCAVCSAIVSGGVMNGKRSTRSMPIARICNTTPSMGTPAMAGGACGSKSFTKCALLNSL